MLYKCYILDALEGLFPTDSLAAFAENGNEDRIEEDAEPVGIPGEVRRNGAGLTEDGISSPRFSTN